MSAQAVARASTPYAMAVSMFVRRQATVASWCRTSQSMVMMSSSGCRVSIVDFFTMGPREDMVSAVSFTMRFVIAEWWSRVSAAGVSMLRVAASSAAWAYMLSAMRDIDRERSMG